jgi:hypothetical protein
VLLDRPANPVGIRASRESRVLYTIVVRSELSDRYAVAFEGMKMEAGRGLTTITGQIVDQSHLHGILTSINALELELLSVQSSYPQHT